MASSNTLNLKSNEVVTNYENSLKIFKTSGKFFNLYSSNNEHLSLIPMELMLFSPLLCDIFNARDVFETPTILMPDSSHTIISHLLNILTEGFTTLKEPKNARSYLMEEVIISGEMLGINICNLFLDTRTPFVSEKNLNIKQEYAEFETEKEIVPFFKNDVDVKEELLLSESCDSLQISNDFKNPLNEKSTNVQFFQNAMKSWFKENVKNTHQNSQRCKKGKRVNSEEKLKLESPQEKKSAVLYTCQMCNFSAKKESKLRKHYIFNHSLENVFKCHHCQFTTNKKLLLRNHFIEVHNVRVKITLWL